MKPKINEAVKPMIGNRTVTFTFEKAETDEEKRRVETFPKALVDFLLAVQRAYEEKEENEKGKVQ